MTITQTVDIPENRRITLDLPPDLPVGKARISIFPVVQEAPEAKASVRMSAQEAIDCCSGITKRLGICLSSDDFLAMGRLDKELEDNLSP